MPKKKVEETKAHEKKENGLEVELLSHYTEAKAELETRIMHKERGFDVYDRVFRNYIDKAKWPFAARVPDGRASTLITRKTDRLIASKLQGKLHARRSGSELGAKIGTELLLYQWTCNDNYTDEPMLLKWRRMDINARKYGASFGFCGWGSDDNPTFEVLNNRDVLLQPGASSILDSEYVQVRRYPTLKELEKINDSAITGPLYDKLAMEKLESMVKNSKTQNTNYNSINRDVLGLDNTKTGRVEIITEYREDKFITFAPKGGLVTDTVILRVRKNPYQHGQIPIVRLVYDQIDDDIYGRPQLENVLPLIKTNWALLSQTLEATTNDLYTPLQVNPKKAQLDTLRFEKGARWLMETPGADVIPFQQGTTALTKFKEHFGLITSLIMEGVGETGQDVSQIQQQVGDKTATEVKDQALLRTASDNANKLLLSQAIAKMVYFWFSMDQQFIDGHKLVRIIGKDALKYLVDEGMTNFTLNDEGLQKVSDFSEENGVEFDEAYETLRQQGMLDEYAQPMFSETVDGKQAPKLNLDKDGKAGFLIVKNEDIQGEYDFIPDVEAMSMPNDQVKLAGRQMLFESILKVAQPMEAQGFRPKWKEIIEKMGDVSNVDDVDQLFEAVPQPQAMPQGGLNAVDPTAGGATPEGTQSQGVPQGGVLPNIPAPVPGQ